MFQQRHRFVTLHLVLLVVVPESIVIIVEVYGEVGIAIMFERVNGRLNELLRLFLLNLRLTTQSLLLNLLHVFNDVPSEFGFHIVHLFDFIGVRLVLVYL